jgi:serine/threonine protein kinase
MTLSSGNKVGPYEIESPLGAGGMGEVYRARDHRLGRYVAIKVLPAYLSNDSDRLRRFEQEARASGLLNHPNALAIYDLGNHNGTPYIVSELLEGETLEQPRASSPQCGPASPLQSGIPSPDGSCTSLLGSPRQS